MTLLKVKEKKKNRFPLKLKKLRTQMISVSVPYTSLFNNLHICIYNASD